MKIGFCHHLPMDNTAREKYFVTKEKVYNLLKELGHDVIFSETLNGLQDFSNFDALLLHPRITHYPDAIEFMKEHPEILKEIEAESKVSEVHIKEKKSNKRR